MLTSLFHGVIITVVREFVLWDDRIEYFSDGVIKGYCYLGDLSTVEHEPSPKWNFGFRITTPAACSKTNKHETLLMQGSSEDHMNEWIGAIKAAVDSLKETTEITKEYRQSLAPLSMADIMSEDIMSEDEEKEGEAGGGAVGVKTPDGTSIDMKPNQAILKVDKEKCDELRSLVGIDRCKDMTDKELQLFLIARKFVMTDTKGMLEEYLKWYTSPIKGMGEATPATILDVPEEAATIEKWKQHFPFAYCGHDKEGCPIYWEKAGITIANWEHAKKDFTNEDHMVWHHILKQEMTVKKHLEHASEYYKKEIYQQVAVCDMAHIKLGLDTATLSYFIRSTHIDQAFYPQRLKKFFIINAPWFFKSIWAVVSPFLGPSTRAKFVLMGDDYLPTLEQYIDPSQIPAYLGGKNHEFIFDSDASHVDPDKLCDMAVQVQG